ncbi:hypothetical protein GCM10010211_03510 [Streptomyces albospinus]|uniref:Secreted protein n=1 Tax=Streptomyces albospinus TaxID=285515 RepID=A0ABQ2ULE7_9ACTN|nr:hypothetical protein [Streptomyces albospinus]GGU43399.1 hypothetical protein GCM10010211_03510 [Streptomyces albospinus]
MQRRFGILAMVCVMASAAMGTSTARAAPISLSAHPTTQAEIFATNNRALITDPADPRLKTRLARFDREVRHVIRANAARAGKSRLLNGVYWSSELKKTTYERSREFDVNRVSAAGLHHIAGLLAKQYHQESVLTFRCLPRTAPDAKAVDIEAPGVDTRRVHDALVADPVAREKLGGGSVTTGGRLILIAPRADLALARKFVTKLGVNWTTARVRYGAEEFVR